jgi:hypothetical protein
MRGHAMAAGKTVGDPLDPDIDRDMLGEQFAIDAQFDVFGNEVRRVIGNAQQAAGPQVLGADLAVGQIVDHHRRDPFSCHHPGCSAAMRAAASSRTASLSNSAKHVAPEPDIRASTGEVPRNAASTPAICGHSEMAGISRSLRPSSAMDRASP